MTNRWEGALVARKKKYDKVCYDKTFLKEVIARVDFPSAIQAVTEDLPAKVRKAALSRFPILEPRKVQEQELQFSNAGFSASTREQNQWAFFGKDREKSIVIGPQHIVQSTKAYSSYEDFADDLFTVTGAFSLIDPDSTVSRIGLRYVNVIELPEGDPLDWSDYINERMLGIIDLDQRRQNISRAFHILEYAFGNINLKFQFGVANPDYPAAVKRRQFVLDLDAYSIGSYEQRELRGVVEDSHALIQEFFELSITDETRNLLKLKGKR